MTATAEQVEALTRPVTIPTIGERWTLAKPWTFNYYSEYRNSSLREYLEEQKILERDLPSWEYSDGLGPSCGGRWFQERTYNGTIHRDSYESVCSKPPHGDDEPHGYAHRATRSIPYAVTLPRGTVLTVDRIYIRKGVKDYDSLTFWAKGLRKKRAVRFWAKLHDVNKMVIYDGEPPTETDSVPEPIRAILLRE